MNTNKRGWKTTRAAFARRLTSLALAVVMLWGLFPGLTPAAEAAEWMEPYLEKLVEWGVMRGSSSGNLNPDRVLTRAEFVTMINRAFGYTERGSTPFQDVPANATAVGVPAQIVRVGGEKVRRYADEVDQTSVVNPTLQKLEALSRRIEELEKTLEAAEHKKNEM